VYADDQHDVNVIAYEPGGVVRPRVVAGRAPARSGEVVVDRKLRVSIGETIGLGGRPFRVVGQTRDLTYYGGTPALLVLLRDGQRIAFSGHRLGSAIVTDGVPTGPLPGLQAMDNEAVRSDLRRPLGAATTTLGIIGAILTLVAAGVVALMVYLAGLDRRLDFAVFKAIGVPTRTLLAGLVLEALLLTLSAAALATLAAAAIAPTFPIELDVSARSYLQLFAIAVVVGLVASAVSVRQTTRIDPALAFGSN
jgi:putative ABC transport system permease protein